MAMANDKAIHQARVILDRTADLEPLKGSMVDSIVAGSFRRNADGSITIRCQISVHDGETGETWMLDDRTIRLPRKKAD